ncbi:MAG: type II toxin-antitoxin system VapC family toxin [bacterium]|nr:type II toxin-antitoxin system VapC family toxin [bacterium]
MRGFLLDTCAISELRKPKPDPGFIAWISAVDETLLHISVVTLAELRIGVEMVADASKRAAIERWLQSDVTARFGDRVLSFDLEVADRWGRMEGRARASGGRLPVIDAQIAATAEHHDLTLVTRNEADFRRMETPIVNPWR